MKILKTGALIFLFSNVYAIDPVIYQNLTSSTSIDVNGQPLAELQPTATGYVLVVQQYNSDGTKGIPVAHIIDQKALQDQMDTINRQISGIQQIMDDIQYSQQTQEPVQTLDGMEVLSQ